MSHHYSRACMEKSELTTVITAKALAFNVKEMEVRIIDEGLVPIYMNSLDDLLILAIKVYKL